MTRASMLGTILAVLLTVPDSRAASRVIRPIVADRVVQGRVIGSPPPPVGLLTVDFADATHGFLATGTGTCPGKGCAAALLATGDGGQSWRTVHTGTIFSELSFVSPNHGYGVSGTGRLMATLDGGRYWSTSLAPARKVSWVDFVDSQHGWFLAGDLYGTVDGGRSWTHLSYHCGTNQTIGRVSFVDSHTGFLLCRVMNGPFAVSLHRSDDGGTSWHRVSVVDSMAHDLGAFDFVSSHVGFVSAGFGNLLRTGDGGRTFRQVPGTPFENVQAISWFGDTGYVAALNALMKTVDAGFHWRQIYPAVVPQGPIALSASGNGVGAGVSWFPAAILDTSDGAHWNLVRQTPGAVAGPPAGTVITSVGGLVRHAAGSFWTVAGLMDRDTFRVYLLRSRDRGKHWSVVLNLDGGSGFVSFTGSRLGAFVTSMPFRLYLTGDGGKTWSQRRQSKQILQVQRVSQSALWAFGGRGRLLHTSDGGRHWQLVDIRVSNFGPDALYFLNPSDGWITGTTCTSIPCAPAILRTRDGGAHWVLIRFRPSFAFDGFDWVTPRIGYVMQNGGLYRTDDGGITWRMLGR